MLQTEYETTIVVRADVGGTTIEGALDKVRSSIDTKGGTLLEIKHWGRKKLAYEINKHNRGIYVHTHYLGANDLVAEIERNLRLNDNVLRFLTVQLDTNVEGGSFEAKEYEMPEYDAVLREDSDDEEEQGDEGADEAKPAEMAAAAEAAPAEAAAEEASTEEAKTEESGDAAAATTEEEN